MLRMKAKFLEEQPPVKTVDYGDKTRVFLALNGHIVTESNDILRQQPINYYEYEVNEFMCATSMVDAIKSAPESYINYTPPKEPTAEERLAALEDYVASLGV